MARCVYVYPLVQLLSQPPALVALSGNTLSSNQELGGRILAMISWNSKAVTNTEDAAIEVVKEGTSSPSSSSSSHPPCCPLYSMLEAAAAVYSSCCGSSSRCASRVRALIRGLEGAGAIHCASLDHIAILLSAVCWWYGDSLAGEGAGLNDILGLFGCLANSDPTMVSYLVLASDI